MIPVMMIAYYNRPDLLYRCLASIDYLVETLVIVDNSPGGLGNAFSIGALESTGRFAKKLESIRHPNAGWAGSCNEVIKLFSKAPWWLLVNNDIQFAPGDLKRMDEAAWAEIGEGINMAAALFGNHGASWWAVTWRGVQRVGLLDENFFPCYLDDCDWCYRAKLSGAKLITLPDCHSVHGDETVPGSCTINSSEELKQKNHRTHGRLFDYYREKWGGVNDHEVFQHPFNNPNWPVNFWVYRPDFRRGQQW